jgi:hypothetical protein
VQRAHACACLEDRRNFADQALEGRLANQQLRGLLVLPNLLQRQRAGLPAVRLWAAHTCGAGALAQWALMEARRVHSSESESAGASAVRRCVWSLAAAAAR